MHVMQLDGSSQAPLVSLAATQPNLYCRHIIHSDLCEANDTVATYYRFVKGVIQHGKEEYESFMPGAVHTRKQNIW